MLALSSHKSSSPVSSSSSSTSFDSSFASPSAGTGPAEARHDETEYPSVSVFCDHCSRFLLPCSVDPASGLLDIEAKQKCADHFNKLVQESVRVSLSKTMLERGIEQGCIICERVKKQGNDLIVHDGTDKLPQQSSDINLFILTAVHPLSRDLTLATGRCHSDVGELLLVTAEASSGMPQEVKPGKWFARFRLFAHKNSMPARYITSRPTYNVNRTIRRAREMMEMCDRYHRLCRQLRTQERTEFPKRVIKVRGNLKGNIQVIPSHGLCGSYAALSYCWGANQPITLNSETEKTLLEGLSITKLPQAIKEAIYVTKRLGLEYLWIDALCILQDDQNEMAEEVSAMDQIYGEAEIVIAATRSAGATQSFLCPLKPHIFDDEVSQLSRPPLPLLYPCLMDNQIGTIYAEEIIEAAGFQEPLNNRAWTFQETSLSRRSLSFYSSQTLWTCPNSEKDISLGDSPIWIPRSRGNDLDNLKSVLGKRSAASEDLYAFWHELLIKYTRRKLSYETDRLAAFAGIAKRFSMVLNDNYLAGIWEKSIPNALAWMYHSLHRTSSEREEPEVLRASWSWASSGFKRPGVVFPVYKSVSIDEGVHTCLLDYDLKPLNQSAPFSKVEHAILKLRTRVGYFEWDGLLSIILDSDKAEKFKLALIPDWATKHMRTAEGRQVIFRMPPPQGEGNIVTRQINLVPVTPTFALMLCETTERRERYYRVGIALHPELLRLADGWEERIIEVE